MNFGRDFARISAIRRDMDNMHGAWCKSLQSQFALWDRAKLTTAEW
jgi:hypothetical protein